MSQTEEVQCPLCSSKISKFHINLTSDLLMCVNESCTYPFETEDVSKFIVQNDEQTVLTPSLEIRNGGTNEIESFPSTSGDLSFDLNPFKNNNDFTFTSPISSVEKNEDITDLSQFDEILNNFSINNNDFITNGMDTLLNEIDFSSTLRTDDSNNLNQIDLNMTLPLINNNELEVTDNLTPIISDDLSMTMENMFCSTTDLDALLGSFNDESLVNDVNINEIASDIPKLDSKLNAVDESENPNSTK
ncbi:14503_t:CDS:2 [Dentiscutata erythropus]|uniref:14503_t:CDS:1 n=1 Tax=Dentiscutata erythropus TaxID=1348616 RepID=A0A9N9ADZ1_9GLOM|nr:14503_t:CDS:2 [Dentiscutata erythropus]